MWPPRSGGNRKKSRPHGKTRGTGEVRHQYDAPLVTVVMVVSVVAVVPMVVMVPVIAVVCLLDETHRASAVTGIAHGHRCRLRGECAKP